MGWVAARVPPRSKLRAPTLLLSRVGQSDQIDPQCAIFCTFSLPKYTFENMWLWNFSTLIQQVKQFCKEKLKKWWFYKR